MREEDQILVVATVVTPVSSKPSKKKQKFSYNSLTLRIHVTLALLQVSYGGFQVLTRVALVGGLSQFVFAIYRNGIAALILSPFAYFLESNKRPSYFKFSDFLRFQALAFTGIVGSQQLFLAGLSLTSPMLAAVSQNMIPVCTFLLSAFLGLEDLHMRRRDGIAKVIGTVICIGGAVLMSLYKGEVLLVWSSSNMQPEVDDAVVIQPFTSLTMCLGTSVASMSVSKFQLGCIFLVLNSVLWAVYLNLQVSTLKIFPAPLTVTVYTYLFGVIQVGILGAVFEGMPNFALTSFNELISVAYATLVASGINFLLQLWCVEKGGPFIVSLYVPIQMIVVAMLSILTLGDPLYMGIVLGGFFTLAGLYLVVYGQAHERWLKQLQAGGLDSTPDLERFGVVKEATDLCKPLLSS
ncbi:hypothetical protein CY35_14G073900 [Sphagnum magellanicum]|nr:hypothetical protein CY35_14G073900 [Sphagnum magellanicum]KAH9541602.1 hypothetical protein CY35_14G073900 [Sphagnum magellanicum]